MVDPLLQSELLSVLDRLPETDQQAVLEYAKSVADRPPRTPQGTPGEALLKFFGSIDEDTLDEMEQVIEEDCGRIDWDGWK